MKKLIIYVFCFCGGLSAVAQPGSLDNSYGDSGKVITQQSSMNHITAGILQPDNKMIIAGEGGQGFLLTRYLPDGNIDSSFGINGSTTTAQTNLAAVTIQQDGKIVAVGRNALVRYLNNGSPDIAFGIGGVTRFGVPYEQTMYAVTVSLDGKIVATGYRDIFTDSTEDFIRSMLLECFLPDGMPDSGFNKSGELVINPYSLGTAVACQPDGKILAGAIVSYFNPTQKFGLFRFLDNGILDSSFGVNGKVLTDFDKNGEELYSLAIQDDGKILAAGRNNINLFTKTNMAVARYLPDGSLDRTFGDTGKVKITFTGGNGSAKSILVQRNKKIVLAGEFEIRAQVNDFALARLNSDGTMDSTFGENGKVITDFGTYVSCNDAGLQDDGKIVLGGNLSDLPPFNIALARYLGDPTHPLITKIKKWIRKHILNFEDSNPNAAYYVIEKSTSAKGAYMPVTKINAVAVNSTYSYPLPSIRNQKPETISYRIKTINKDSSISYTDAIPDNESNLQITKSTNQQIHIYPNPARDKIYIQSSREVNLRLQNGVGQVIIIQKIKGSGSIDISRLVAGIYYIVDVGSGERFKMVKE